jgi:hypothetical protein
MSTDKTTITEQSPEALLANNQSMFSNPGENQLPVALASNFGEKVIDKSTFLRWCYNYNADAVPTGNNEFVPGANNPENVGIIKLTLQEIGINCSRAGKITMGDINIFTKIFAEMLDGYILNNQDYGLIANAENPNNSTIENFPDALIEQINAARQAIPGEIAVFLNSSVYGVIYNHQDTVNISDNRQGTLFHGAEVIFVPRMNDANLALVISKNSLHFAFPRYFRVATTVNTATMHPFFSIVGSIGVHSNNDGIRLINLQQ